MTWTPDICIHHFPCDDGFASAWVARKRWPNIQCIGTNYGQPFPDVDVRLRDILIADFSYKPDALREIIERGARSIVVLDHHKTAQADLADFVDGSDLTADRVDERPTIVARFDMERSGASLTWDFCFPGQPRPAFIAMIEDRDLWRMKLPGTRAFSLYLRSHPYDFEAWDVIAQEMVDDTATVLNEAHAIERFYDRKIAEMLPTATLKSIGQWKGVPVAHAPYAFASDLANELLKAHPDAPFAAVVVDSYGARTYSLRSTDDRQDVSEVARSFGGGGHRNAAGFRVPA